MPYDCDTTRFIRSVDLERRFWNEKLKDGKGDWDWEAAYHEQLRRPICAECGDGLCPVEDDRRPPIT